MTKSEHLEMNKLWTLWTCREQFGANEDEFLGIAARTISALIRAARTTVSSDSLWDYADSYGVRNHANFIV